MSLGVEVSEDVKQLSYFKDLRERRAWMARLTVLLAVLALLVLNMYLLFIAVNTVILNIDLARIEQSDQADAMEKRMDAITNELAGLRDSIEESAPPPAKE